MLFTAIQAPMQQIVKNAGYVPEVISAQAVENSEHGFNSLTGAWVDMYDLGIIDPLLVVKSALEHAVSAATNLLSVGCAISFEEVE